MSAYRTTIIEATHCSPGDAGMIEHIMRDDIFHSTLDWQTRAQLRGAARKAAEMLQENRELYEFERTLTRAIFEQMKQTAGRQAEA